MKVKEDILIKISKAASRQIAIEDGSYGFSFNRVHRNKKKYNRKDKSWKNYG